MSRSSIRITLFALVAILLLALPGSALARKHQRHAKPRHARIADRNHDGLPDKWEKANHLSLKVNQAPRDPDKDGLSNSAEFVAGTDPKKADSNGNGIPDGQENAGKVVSFDKGVLTIAGFDGTTVSGTVDATTELRCRTLGQTRSDDDQNEADGQNQGDDDATATPPHPAVIASAADSGQSGDDDVAANPPTLMNPGATPPAGTTPQGTGDHHGDDNEGDGHGSMPGCDPATVLVKDAVVHEATLKMTATGNVWAEIKLVLNPPAAPVAPVTTPAPATQN